MKIKNVLFGIIILILAFSINSCAPAYVPNVVNAPLLNNKSELQASVHAGVSGTDLQLAYALTKNLGIMVNGSFIDNTSDSTNNYHKHNFFEAGLGYYTKFNQNGHFDIFGGYGYGIADVKANILNTDYITKATYHRYFIQPDFGFSSEFLDIAFAPRFVVANIKPEYFQYSHKTKLFVEPTGIVRLGYKYFYLTSQLGLSIPLTKGTQQDIFESQPVIFSLGLQIKLGKIYDNSPRYNN